MNPRAALYALAGLAIVFAAYLLLLRGSRDFDNDSEEVDTLPRFIEEARDKDEIDTEPVDDKGIVPFSFFEPGDMVDDVARPRLLRHYGSEKRSGADDLRLVRGVLEHFWRTSKDPDQLVLGSNEDLLRGLAGDNSLGIEFVSKRNKFLDTEGRLLDRWGSPLFFHANSVTDIEIRSNGPDRIRYTDDDLVSRAKSSLRLMR